MTVTATIQLYKFEELDDKARERIKHSEVMADWKHDHISFVVSDLENYVLPDEGYEDAKIDYSIGFCQGDGLMFTATVPLRKWARAHGYTLTPELGEMLDAFGWEDGMQVNIETRSRDPHWRAMFVDPEYQVELEDAIEDGDITEDQANQYRELCGDVQERAQARARQLYRTLSDEILRFYDDDFLREEFFYNEILFLPNGELAPHDAKV